MDIFSLITNYVGLIIALAAFFVSFSSMYISRKSLKTQEKHNQLSVKPIGKISLDDYEDQVSITIKNSGSGPMIIKSIETFDNMTKKKYPIEWMPNEITWRTFDEDLEECAIRPGKHETLLCYELDSDDGDSIRERDEIRKLLSRLTIRIEYMDIYGQEQPVLIRSLDWFNR